MAMRYIRFFSEICIDDIPIVGGKNASLGEMYRGLASAGVRVPNGFAITAEAYRAVLEEAGAWGALRATLSGLDPKNVEDMGKRAAAARDIVQHALLPNALVEEIRAAYAKLREEYGDTLSLAVRSSATAEDLPNASFAGQHDSYLNIAGEAALLDAVQRCFASLFTERAIRYRIDNGFDHFKVFNSVGVMKMVRSDSASSGVIFTLDTETGFQDVVFITGAYGLGENVVQGTVDPDEFYVFKPLYRAGKRMILKRSLGRKEKRMVYGTGGRATENLPTAPKERARFCLSDAEVLQLAGQAVAIEDHYSAKAGTLRPMDIEWAKDGLDGNLYIVQARAETVASRKDRSQLEEYHLKGEASAHVIAMGRAVGTKIASGHARVISQPSDLDSFVPGEILVANTTSPDWGSVMQIAAAIVTNRGGRTCHAAIVAREHGIPAVVGTEMATIKIATGDAITVVCSEGETGKVFEGTLGFTVEKTDLKSLARPATEVMLNVGDPEAAFGLAIPMPSMQSGNSVARSMSPIRTGSESGRPA